MKTSSRPMLKRSSLLFRILLDWMFYFRISIGGIAVKQIEKKNMIVWIHRWRMKGVKKMVTWFVDRIQGCKNMLQKSNNFFFCCYSTLCADLKKTGKLHSHFLQGFKLPPFLLVFVSLLVRGKEINWVFRWKINWKKCNIKRLTKSAISKYNENCR